MVEGRTSFATEHSITPNSHKTAGPSGVQGETAISFIIDDDSDARHAIAALVASLGMRPIIFETAAAYLAFRRPDAASCLILDLEPPDANGLEFQAQLAGTGHPPIIFVADHGDIRSSVYAMKHGAIDFLTKPLRNADLTSAIVAALDLDRASRSERAEIADLRQRLSALTPRECDVLPLVTSGLLNKQAAAELCISEVTYQIHRSNIMRKMQAASLPDLVRMAGKLQIPVTHARRARLSGNGGYFSAISTGCHR